MKFITTNKQSQTPNSTKRVKKTIKDTQCQFVKIKNN